MEFIMREEDVLHYKRLDKQNISLKVKDGMMIVAGHMFVIRWPLFNELATGRKKIKISKKVFS